MSNLNRGLTIVILAAGQGTRMKSTLPKVLHPIGGKPMLSHVITTARNLMPQQVIVVHGYGGELLQKAYQHQEIIWAEQPHQQGTGDAVAKALPFIANTERVLILYGDVPLITAQTLQHLLQQTPLDALGLLTLQNPDPTGLGRIVRDEHGKITRIVEERDANENQRQITEVNTGIFLVNAKHLKQWIPQLSNHNQQAEYYLTDIIELAVSQGVSIVTTTPASLFEVQGVNDKKQLNHLERYYQQQQALQLLEQGVWIADPQRFDVRGSLQAQAEVFIDVNVIFEGDNRIQSHSHIGPHCVLIDCIVGKNVKILAHSHLEGVIIGDNVTVGPFARLRPGTILNDQVKVGNFVEIKQSTIGEGSKINHLSYIGDTTMGKAVNIGAGTITCNYDGTHKHPTIIEDNVNVGSDSQLIAPVHISKGATIAAGSTLIKDAPGEQLTLTHRLEQRSYPWNGPKKSAAKKTEKEKM